jgi:protein SCO1/2
MEMTRKMQSIQAALPAGSDVTLLSLTADPAYDNPTVLKQYAGRFKATPSNWHFLTGPKMDVYRLAIEGLKLAVQENTDGKPDENQFIHSTRFVLIDRHGRLRGVPFDGTEAATIPDILRAVRQLLAES